MNREREFEDDRIIRWRVDKSEENYDDDPTIMSIKQETEEIYESRAYNFGSGPAQFFAADVMRRRQGTPKAAIARVLLALGEGTGFKILAKRSRADGLITFMLVLGSREGRGLLARGEGVAETEYRQFVESFEEAVLPSQLVEPPIVIGLKDWHQYEQNEG